MTQEEKETSTGETAGEARDVRVLDTNPAADIAFSPLALGRVSPDGFLANQLRLLAEHMAADFEDMSPDCKSDGTNRSGWLGGTGESWERGTYYTRGLVTLAYVLQDTALMTKAQKWIDWTLGSQTESGAFGPYADDPEHFDYWPLMPMLMTLEYYCDATGDERVIPFLSRYFAWQAEALKTTPLSSWGGARGGDNIFAVWWLYEKTGDASLPELCDLLYRQTDDWAAAYDEDAWRKTYHIVNVQESFKLFPLMYALTGEKKWLDTYYRGIENIYIAAGRADGMSNGDEVTRGISATYGNETCAVVERMLCDEIALFLLRDASVADHLEDITYNALPQQLLPDGRGQVYFTMQNQVMATLGHHGFTSDGGDRSVYGVPGGFPCCIHNYMMGYPLFVASMWMQTADNRLAVGAYGPCTVRATVGNGTALTLTEQTVYPYGDTVSLTLHADKADTYPLYLRVPSWCASGEAVVTVNGREVVGTWTPGSYFRLEAEWKDGDEIRLTFPMRLRVSYAENNSLTVRYGGVLFALELTEKWKVISYNPNNWTLRKGYTSYSITTDTPWNMALVGFDPADPERIFTVTRGAEVGDDMLYDQAHAPWILTAEARAVPDWVLNQSTQTAGRLPVSPVNADRLDRDTVTVRLIPYAFSRLRMTCIPWSGDGETSVTVDAGQTAEDTLTFVNVIAPAEFPEHIGDGKPEITRTLLLTGTPGTYTLYINRAVCGTVEVNAAGSGRIDAPALRYDSRNLVELRTSDGKALPHGAHMTLRVLSESDGSIRYEAESARVAGGAAIRGDHVGGMSDVGSTVIFPAVTFPQAGTYRIRVYYTAPQGDATHSLMIDDTQAGKLHYPANPLCTDWGTFDARVYADFEVDVPAGTHVLRLVRGADDIGFAELDALSVCLTDAHPVDKVPGVRRETIAQVEAEDCKVSGGCYVSTRHVAGIDKIGDTVELTLSVPTDGTYTFRIYYTAPMGDATHTLFADGNRVGCIRYAGTTSGWGEFQPGNYAEVTLTLSSGTHTVRITRTAADVGFAELDRFELLS